MKDNLAYKVKRFREIVTELADLYERDNGNYKKSFSRLYDLLGPISGLVPLYNKLEEVTSLIRDNGNNFESIEDTLKDLATYVIMNLVETELHQAKEENLSSLVNDIEVKYPYRRKIDESDDLSRLKDGEEEYSCEY